MAGLRLNERMSGYQEKKKKKERDKHYVFIYLTALRSQQGLFQTLQISDCFAAQCLRPAPAVVAGTGK